MSELVVPAHISKVTTLDPGEIRIIELSLPKQLEIEHVVYPVLDVMRPGTAFLAKPWGERTDKWRRRMYTRSNSALESPHKLETIINFTHTDKSDTSVWWQTEEVVAWQQSGKPLDVRVEWNSDHSAFMVYENSRKCHATNLYLEPDGEWEHMKFLALAFSTGITPFLSYLRYMRHYEFGQSRTHPGVVFQLIVSVRHPRQLMAHEELLTLEHQFPNNFRYHPVLTRSWPSDWPFTTGRVIRNRETSETGDRTDISPLVALVPDIDQYHVRFCGNKIGRDQLLQSFQQNGIQPRSVRAEVW